MSTMSDHQKVTVVPTEKIPFDQLPLPSKVGGTLEFTNLSIVQTVTTVSILTVSSESTTVSAGSVPPEATTLPPEGTVPPKVTTESIVSVPWEVSATFAKSVPLNTIESTESAPSEVTSESIESVLPEETTLPPEGTVPSKVTTTFIESVPLEESARSTENAPLNTGESIESAHLKVTSESIESVPPEVTILPPVGTVPPKVTTGSTMSVSLEVSATSTESAPLNTGESIGSVPLELTSKSIESIPLEVTTLPPVGIVPSKVTTGSTMDVPLELFAVSTESVPLNTVELTRSAAPEVTSEATENVPPNATTMSLTSVPREPIVESTGIFHPEVTSKSTKSNPTMLVIRSTESAPSEVTTKPTEGVVPDPELITKARDDAINLNRAFAGWGCDQATILNILAHRSAKHRTQIRQEYKIKFSEDFDHRLSKELMFSPDLKRALLLWMDDPASRDAKLVKHGLSKNLNVAIEVICSRTPSQLEELKKAYRSMFTTYLDEDIESLAHDNNKKLLLAYAGAIRSESPEVDAVMVDKDATDLFKDGEWRYGTNEETFIRIFSERSGAHLVAINSVYRKMYVNSLKKAVKKETSSKFKRALLTILQCAENPEKYFAKALHKAMAGLGTDDETLTRIIVSRAEVDINKIKAEYLKKYGKSLSDDVHEDTSGQYRAFLLSLLNPNA
ncbi:hypothetical protein RHSIM_RhsimUnG0039300 [Rhododendron simsii]|uniref:Annexin n=1 Tax=Rhododendron simsii TaxID=118357 RepID=A0A834L2Y7_RHOSS|nr:hypothetical protein RHSIM_RhsimUnG0039300 [Rhododendron simsii]